MEEKGASTCLDFLGGLCSGFRVCVCVCVTYALATQLSCCEECTESISMLK